MLPVSTRIANKRDTEYNWILQNPGFIPYDGELIIYEAETIETPLPEGRTDIIPYARFKIGDGKRTVVELPFSSSMIRLITWEEED